MPPSDDAKPDSGPSIGLALSGGGFRATLYHLGVIRALRDQGLLTRVNAISSVSGGSILAAHLVLHWHRYTSPKREDFDEVVEDLLSFVRLGPRGRILHRLPWISLWGLIGSVLRFLPGTNLNHSDLLQHYLSRLYRNQDLGSLADTEENVRLRPNDAIGRTSRPDLYILATNLTTGGLCAFTDEGMMPSVTVGALSSTENENRPKGSDSRASDDRTVTAKTGSVTGGTVPPNDTADAQETGKDTSAEPATETAEPISDPVIGIKTGMIPISMAVAASAAIPHFFPPVVVSVKPLGVDRSGVKADPQYTTDGGVIDNSGAVAFRTLYRKVPGQKLWKPVTIRRPDGEESRTHKDRVDLNMILVSLAGGPLDFQATDRLGTISTATRSVDILMDRISRLAVDGNDESLITIDIQSEIETRPELIADVQRTLKRVRTDLDRFSKVEINALLKHGYEVGRTRIEEELEAKWRKPKSTELKFERTLPEDTDYPAWRYVRWGESRSIPERVIDAVRAFGLAVFLLIAMGILAVWRLIPLIWALSLLRATGSAARRILNATGSFLRPDSPTATQTTSAAGEQKPAEGPKIGMWQRIRKLLLEWWGTELRLAPHNPVRHLRGPHEERQRTRVLMKSSRRRILSGSSSDWMAPLNILIFVSIVVLGLWNLYSYYQRPGFEVGFDDFPGEQWQMEFQYADYPSLFLGSLKRVEGKDPETRESIRTSLQKIAAVKEQDLDFADVDNEAIFKELLYDSLNLPHYRSYLLLKESADRAREEEVPEQALHTAKSKLRASRDLGDHYPWPFGDRWFGRGRIVMPTDEQFDYTFDIQYYEGLAVANFHIPSLFQRNNPRTYKALLVRAEAPVAPKEGPMDVHPIVTRDQLREEFPAHDGLIVYRFDAGTDEEGATGSDTTDDDGGANSDDSDADPDDSTRDSDSDAGDEPDQLPGIPSLRFKHAGDYYYVGELFRLNNTPDVTLREDVQLTGDDVLYIRLDGQIWQSMGTRVIFQRTPQ